MISKNKLILVVFQVFALKLFAQLEDPIAIMYNNIFDSSLYFQTYVELSDKESLYLESPYSSNYLEMFATLNSYVGRYDDAMNYFYKRNIQKGYSIDTIINIDVKDCGISQGNLNDLYKQYNIVLFNEEHHNPQYRAFVCSQLIFLKEKGFNQLALEALNAEDTNIHERMYPIAKSGFYTAEPIYGNLIRQALELDFELISYDNSTLRRDKTQAKNIYKEYSPESGKLIVFGGYGHIAQKGLMMGQHLKKMAKEDVLSISQFIPYKKTQLINTCDKELYLKEDQTGYFDYYLHFNPQPQNANIPGWYNCLNYYTVPLKELIDKPLVYPCLVQVKDISEDKGIPVYQYLAKSTDTTDINIVLPQKKLYNIIIISENCIDTIQFSL